MFDTSSDFLMTLPTSVRATPIGLFPDSLHSFLGPRWQSGNTLASHL